jgi:predicted permease
VRQVLVVAQFALATLLVVASALLVQQFQAIQKKELGFAPERVLSARLTLPDDDNGTHYTENMAAYTRLLEAVRALPGVERAGLGSEVPLGQLNTTSMAAAPGAKNVQGARNGGLQVNWRVASSDFLETLGVPLVRGRLFMADGESGRSMVVSESVARRLWSGGEDPVGRQLTLSNSQTYNVVGVVGDVRHLERAAEPPPTVYMSTNWSMLSTMTLALKTRVDPEQAIAAVREAAARTIPDRPLFEMRPMSAVIAENVAEPRAQTAVLSLFGAVSLLLAALGVAGVTAYTVVRRTSELAVRMALGATQKRVIGHVMARGWVLCGAGVAAGTLLVVALAQVAGSLTTIPDVRVAPTLVAVALVLSAVGLLACWIPARRAARISPSLTLRGE